MKWVLIVGGAFVLLVLMVFAIGVSLPQSHTASVRARYSVPPESIYAAITDVASGPSWRTGLDSVEVTSQDRFRWREHSSFGALEFERRELSPSRVSAVILGGREQGFGGTWTWQLSPVDGGTELTITEDGEVYSAFFRFMSRFIFGHYSTLEQYARDLGARFGERVEPQRLE